MSDHTCCPDLEAGAHADDCAERPAVEFLGRFGPSDLETQIDAMVDAGYGTRAEVVAMLVKALKEPIGEGRE